MHIPGIRNGLREAWAHKFRSMLSMLGIILGVASLVAMMGVSKGLIQSFKAFFEAQGGIEKVEIDTAQPPESQTEIAHLSPGLTLNDVYALQNTASYASHIAAHIQVGWPRMFYRGRAFRGRLTGVTSDFQVAENSPIGEGRYISDIDNANANAVIVIGTQIVKELYDKNEPVIGSIIKIHNRSFTVIGVLEEFMLMQNGRNILRWKNRFAYIPARTAIREFMGNDKLTKISLKVRDASLLPALVDQIDNTLQSTHNGIQDYEISTAEEQLAELRKKEGSFTLALGSLAGITLLVGSIGIANVMLASINERIREIGVRKAVGAQSVDIFVQFVAEAVAISVIGGLLGLLASAGLISILSSVLEGESIPITVTTNALIIGFSFSVFAGIAAGIYPALKAAKLDPIEALRYE